MMMFSFTFVNAQEIRDHRKGQKTLVKPTTTPVTISPEATLLVTSNVVLFENANFTGQSKSFGVGMYRFNSPADFNDIASSIKVPNDLVAIIYEHANEAGGYGNYIDLMEDCPDLSTYGFNDKASYLHVFSTSRPGFAYARNRNTNNQFVAGHWERERANSAKPDNSLPAVVLSLEATRSSDPSILAVNGPNTTITSLGVQSAEGSMLWERATNQQMGIIGNDYRGIEEIGSAAFERDSHVAGFLDFQNFWYVQKQKNDHRSIVYFKRTLAGKVREALQVQINGAYSDYDVNIDIVPDSQFMYLLNDAHPREYTHLMERQWQATGALPYIEQSGMPNCDAPETIEEFSRLEAEIAEDYWPKGNTTFGRARLADMTLLRVGKEMCVYGTWIYDRGHCCHPEIHPAEQLWWSDLEGNGKKYNLNVVCDASRRFFWRKQMDDGTKIKPWAEPPVKGLFAIAFKCAIPRGETAVGQTTRQFEAGYIQHYNLAEYPGAEQTYNLVYQNKTLVSFIPHNNAFKVSFEHVGIIPGSPDTIRGFLVIETSVGRLTQVATSILVPSGNSFQTITLPANSAPSQASEQYEDKFFKKEEGHYYFTIVETSISIGPSSNDEVIR